MEFPVVGCSGMFLHSSWMSTLLEETGMEKGSLHQLKELVGHTHTIIQVSHNLIP